MRFWVLTVVLSLLLAGCTAPNPAAPVTSAPAPEEETVPPATLTDAALATPQTGFAVDSGGTVYRSDDGGRQWTKLFHDPSASLWQIQFQDAQNGFTKGFARCDDVCPVLYTTGDGGAHWNLIQPSLPPGLEEAWGGATTFPTPKVGYTVNRFGVEGGDRDPNRRKFEQIVLATTDGGHTWEARPLPDGYRATGGISFVDADHGLITAAGSKGDAILRTEDGGRNWKIVHMTEGTPNGAPLYTVQFTSPKEAVAAGGWYLKWGLSPMQLVLASHDGGETWSEIYRGDDREAAAIVQLRFTDPQTGWARTGIATIGANGTIPGRLLLTRDGGRTWQKTGETTERVSQQAQRLSAVGQAVWLLDLRYPAGSQREETALLHLTQDNGASWQTVSDLFKPSRL